MFSYILFGEIGKKQPSILSLCRFPPLVTLCGTYPNARTFRFETAIDYQMCHQHNRQPDNNTILFYLPNLYLAGVCGMKIVPVPPL